MFRKLRSMYITPSRLKHLPGTNEGDVYSMGIIFHEVLEQRGTFFTGLDFDDITIIKKVIH